MVTLMRAYLGFRLPQELLSVVGEAQMELKRRLASAPVRWYEPSQFVLTLASLGEQSPEVLHEVIRGVWPVCARTTIPLLTLEGWTGLPNAVSPKQLAVAVGGEVSELGEFQVQLSMALAHVVPISEKQLTPHVLVGALRVESAEQRTLAGQAMRHLKSAHLATFPLSRLEVLRSVADERGVRYESLAEVPLVDRPK